jgi:ribosomal protein L11 methyltransferase
MRYDEVLEVSVECDSEAAEAVSELFNRYNGGGYVEDSETGEASGGGAVMEITGLGEFGEPIEGEYRIVVKTYLRSGARGDAIRRKLEEGLWHLGQIYPMPEPVLRIVQEEDWAHAWKKHYKPLRVGRQIVLKPSWEAFTASADDLVVELDPGMAFGTGLHPSTRLCITALEDLVQRGDAVLDVGAGSGVLSIVAAKLGAGLVYATDIDPVAIDVTKENIAANGLDRQEDRARIEVLQGSVPSNMQGRFQIVVANILAEVLAELFDGAYGNIPLADPLAPGGHMILAGIIDEKADIVIDAGKRHRLTLLEQRHESDWVALILRKAVTES